MYRMPIPLPLKRCESFRTARTTVRPPGNSGQLRSYKRPGGLLGGQSLRALDCDDRVVSAGVGDVEHELRLEVRRPRRVGGLGLVDDVLEFLAVAAGRV